MEKAAAIVATAQRQKTKQNKTEEKIKGNAGHVIKIQYGRKVNVTNWH